MSILDTSITGTSGGVSPEEEVVTKLLSSLCKLDFDPVVLCGWRSFSCWLEVLCGTSLGQGVSSDGRGQTEFKVIAEATGRIGFKLSRETINTRSAMAWQVAEQHILVCRNSGLAPDDLVIYDRRSLTK